MLVHLNSSFERLMDYAFQLNNSLVLEKSTTNRFLSEEVLCFMSIKEHFVVDVFDSSSID